MTTRPRLLVLGNFLPRYNLGTGDWYVCDVLRGFAKHYDVHFLARRWDQIIHRGQRDDHLQNLLRQGYTVDRLTKATLGRALRDEQTAAAMVWVDQIAFTHILPLRESRPDLPIVYVAMDAAHLALRARAAWENNPVLAERGEVRYRRQRNAVEAATATIFVSPDEADLLRREVPGALVTFAPVVVAPRETDPGRRVPDTLVFACNMGYKANTDSLIHFLGDAYGRIVERVPGVVLNVLGGDPPPEVQKAAHGLPGVRFLGFVDDYNAQLDHARVAVIPLVWGAGIKGKVVEAMASGLPVVTTSVGVQGLRGRQGDEVLVADTGAEFADAVVRVLGDPAMHQKQAERARRYVAEYLSPQVIQRQVDEVVACLQTLPRPTLSEGLRTRLRRDAEEVFAEDRPVLAEVRAQVRREALGRNRVYRLYRKLYWKTNAHWPSGARWLPRPLA